MPERRGRQASLGSILLLIAVIIIYTIIRLYGNNATTNAPTIPQTGPNQVTAAPQLTGLPGAAPVWGKQQKTSGCVAQNGLPDPACTPGDIISTATKDQICQSGYSSSVRNVTVSEKDQVYAEYGIPSHSAGQYEVDHLVSLELGGSNDISNLWPELASPKPGFHEKDMVENYLHDQVCSGAMSLHDAQVQIATNWLAVYQNIK